MTSPADYDRLERDGDLQEECDTRDWMIRIGLRLERGLPVTEAERAIWDHNNACAEARWPA